MPFEVVTRNIFLRNCFFPLYTKTHTDKMDILPEDLKELVCELPSTYLRVDTFINDMIGRKFDSIQDITMALEHYEPNVTKTKLSVEDRSIVVDAETIRKKKQIHVPVAYIVELSD